MRNLWFLLAVLVLLCLSGSPSAARRGAVSGQRAREVLLKKLLNAFPEIGWDEGATVDRAVYDRARLVLSGIVFRREHGSSPERVGEGLYAMGGVYRYANVMLIAGLEARSRFARRWQVCTIILSVTEGEASGPSELRLVDGLILGKTRLSWVRVHLPDPTEAVDLPDGKHLFFSLKESASTGVSLSFDKRGLLKRANFLTGIASS